MHITYFSIVSVGISAVLQFVLIRVWQFPKVGQSHKIGEVGSETNVRVISVPKSTVIGHPLFQLLLKTCSQIFWDTCWYMDSVHSLCSVHYPLWCKPAENLSVWCKLSILCCVGAANTVYYWYFTTALFLAQELNRFFCA